MLITKETLAIAQCGQVWTLTLSDIVPYEEINTLARAAQPATDYDYRIGEGETVLEFGEQQAAMLFADAWGRRYAA